MVRRRYLIIRFSSFGDIMQALPAATLIREKDPTAEIHWLTRSDFAPVVKSLEAIDQVWALRRQDGWRGLFRLIGELRRERFTHLYDAHSNLRSGLIIFALKLNAWVTGQFSTEWAHRSKDRLKRILLFRFRINLFEKPFRGAHSYLAPLKKWFGSAALLQNVSLNLDSEILQLPVGFDLENTIALAPGAAWGLKLWPTENWQKLVRANPQFSYVLLGGPDDKMCEEIVAAATSPAVNLAGRLSWLQSLQLIELSRGLVAGDTGLLHAADLMQKPAVAIIGPTAFGYPSHDSTLVAEIDLPCRPCTKDGRGRCHNSVMKRCLVELSADRVSVLMNQLRPNSEF